MLSKSQAKAFFLIGTGVFSAIFIGLTVDTFQRIPKQTNAAEMNASVVRGKHLFDKSNCMGCHTILGEGAYYAPELTKVYDRRGPAFIKAMLKDPQAMYPGQRKMTNYKFSDPEMEDLTAFLQWVGTMDLNGFPPKPDILSNATVARPNADGAANSQPKVFSQMCIPCHSLGGQGGSIGPALDGVGSRLEMSYIANWLADPTLVKPGTQMPKLPLSTEEIDALAKYLSSLKGGAQ